MNKFLLLFIIVMFGGNLVAQECFIEGKVLYLNTPLNKAEVKLSTKKNTYRTDSLGSFKTVPLPYGVYTITITKIGFSQFQESFICREQKISVSATLTENENEAEEVIVTGTMRESYVSESPIKVDVINAAMFKKNPSPTIFEALNMINGVQPQINCNVCNTGDIHINGMEGPYTMITIDGMPIVSGLSTVYGLSGIPTSLVKRVEVIKGPASTLYGSEAVGGLVNIITKEPSENSLATLGLMSTSHLEHNADLGLNLKVRKINFLTGIDVFSFTKKRDVNQDNFTDIALQSRVSVFEKISFSRTKARKASLAFRYINENRWGGEMQWSPEFRGGDSVYGESVLTKRWETFGVYQLPMDHNLQLQYSLTSHHQNSAYGKVAFTANQSIAFFQLIWNTTLAEKHALTVGFPVRYTYYDDNTAGTQTMELKNRPSRILLPGLFLQDQFSWSEKVLLFSGIRYDYNSAHGQIFTPRIGVKVKPFLQHVFRVNAGNGYRVVNLFTEDHAALTGARTVVIKNKLKPEKSWNANVNYQYFINHKKGFSNIDVSVFYTYFLNKILGDYTIDPDKIIYDNLEGYAISKGVNLNTEMNLMEVLKLNLGATFMDVFKVDAGKNSKEQQFHAPKFSGTYSATWIFPKIKLSIDYTGRVAGPMRLPIVYNDFRPAYSPWFSIHNINFTKSVNSYLEFFGGAKNIFNFIPKNPLLRPFDPFDKKAFNTDGTFSESNPNGYTFDTEYNYASIQGMRLFGGLRIQIKNLN